MKDMILYGTFTVMLLLVFSFYADAASEMAVSVRPGTINSFQCNSVTGKIIIETQQPGEYDIAISGVPDSWLEYPGSVRVDSRETVSYMVNPRSGGTYLLTVIVDGPGGYAEEEVSFWAGRKETAGLDGPAEGPVASGGGLTGLFTLAEQDQAVMAVLAVVIASVFAVFLGHRSLKPEDPYDGMGF